MKIHQVRNATILVEINEHRILVDPMLSPPSTMPGFRMFRGERRKNPAVALPDNAMETIESATCVLITHEHPDHLDKPALEWIKSRKLPVWSGSIDTPNLTRKGLDARTLPNDDFGIPCEVLAGRHGHGFFGWLMGPVSAFYFAPPNSPSVFLTGDTVLTDVIRDSIRRLQPDLLIAPAGTANFGIGKDLLFSIDELVELPRLTPGVVIFNHLEALDHCLTTREKLGQRMEAEGFGPRVLIPHDGEDVDLSSVKIGRRFSQ